MFSKALAGMKSRRLRKYLSSLWRLFLGGVRFALHHILNSVAVVKKGRRVGTAASLEDLKPWVKFQCVVGNSVGSAMGYKWLSFLFVVSGKVISWCGVSFKTEKT
jgi:hypothetical protein